MTVAPQTTTAAAPTAPAVSASPGTSAAPARPGPGAAPVLLHLTEGWFTACDPAALTPGRGVAVLLPDGGQAALFLDRAGRVYAVDNHDPFTGAAVLSRGLLGSARGRAFVASPLLKQRFDLTDGRCLDDDAVSVRTYEVRTGPA